MFNTLFDPTAVFNRLYDNDLNSISISQHSYKRISKSLLKHWTRMPVRNNVDFYINPDKTRMVLRITNEVLAVKLYPVIKSGLIIPQEFEGLKFVTLDSEEMTAFVVYNFSYQRYEELIISFVDIIDKFCAMLSTDEEKIYVSYSDAYSDLSRAWNTWIEILFRNIRFTPSIETPADTNYIITRIFEELGYSPSIKDISRNLSYSSKPFYAWLNEGILYPCPERKAGNVPLGFEINALKHISEDSILPDVHELFKYDEKLLSTLKDCDDDVAIVINTLKFEGALYSKGETDDFVIFKDVNGYTFAKLKDASKFNDYIRNLRKLTNLMEVCEVKFLVSSYGRYVSFKDLSYKSYSLKERIEHFENTPSKFISLLHTLYEWGKSQSYINNLYFFDNIELLSSLGLDSNTAKVTLLNPLDIAFENGINSSKFSYMKLIFLVCAHYMQYTLIDMAQLYTVPFIKAMNPFFVEALIKFINTGTYVEPISEEIFNGCDADKLEFVENIDANSPLLERISFIGGYNPKKEIHAALEKHKQEELNNGCHSLDTFKVSIKPFILTANSISEFFMNPDYSKYFMTPEKIIVSKNMVSDGKYKVIGIVWNHCMLKPFINLIGEKILTCNQIYTIIYELLVLSSESGCSIRSFASGKDYLMIDLRDNSPVFYNEGLKYSSYERQEIDLKNYYDKIMKYLKSFAEFENSYDAFRYHELVPNRTNMWPREQLKTFWHSAKNMAKCIFHDRYHLPGELCPLCKEIFEVKDVSSILSNVAYEDSLSAFGRGRGFTVYTFKVDYQVEHYLNEVRLGLENGLYEKFEHFKPVKLIGTPNGDVTHTIMYSDCNFENIIQLDSFKNMRRLKTVLVLYKKLLPLIQEGSFLVRSREVFTTLVMHKDYKGSILIPNLSYLLSSVILDNDEKEKFLALDDTKRYFADFLVEYLMGDEYIANCVKNGIPEFTEIIEDIKNHTFSTLPVKKCVDSYKKYCLTHNTPYATSCAFCPECAKAGIKDEFIIFKDKTYFTELESKNTDFDGGEAFIYPDDEGTAIKIFKSHVDLPFKTQILAKAIEKDALIQNFNKEHPDIHIVTVSKLLYLKQGSSIKLKGFTQEFIPDSYKISSLKDREFVKEQKYSLIDIVDILCKVSKAIEFLHSIGGFIGDLNGGNILIKGNKVYVIDIDGMSFDDVRNCVYTNMYIYPPSAESNNITMDDDWYSLAIQAFYYMTYSHPFRGVCNNSKVPANEMERMKAHMSVLGDHNIAAPNISIGWDFLPEDMLNYFLDTFEGTKRESMLSILEAYLNTLKKYDGLFVEVERKSSVKLAINEDTYVTPNHDIIYKENQACSADNSCIFSFTEHGLITFGRYSSYFLSFKGEYGFTFKKSYSRLPMYVYDSGVYYTTSNKRGIVVDKFSEENRNYYTYNVEKPTNYEVITLLYEDEHLAYVEDNDKSNSYDIYIDSNRIYSISKLNFTTLPQTAGIDFDPLTKKRIVVFFSEESTKCIVVEKDLKTTSSFTINKKISESFSFYGNTLYYVGHFNIFGYNINTAKTKCISCVYATENSLISRRENKFVLVNKDKTYVYQKTK